MVTNEERKKVAARLRKIKPSSFGTIFDVIREVGLCVNPDGVNLRTLPLELADLIEPEPKRTCHIVKWFEATTRSELGRERVELSCGHFAERHSKFCPSCGARVVKNG